jgi:hypothetical protein
MITRALATVLGVYALLLLCIANPLVLHLRFWTAQAVLQYFLIDSLVGTFAVALLWGQRLLAEPKNEGVPPRHLLLISASISVAAAGLIHIVAYVLHQ